MQQTLAKFGKNLMPLVGGLCLTVDFDQMWSKICPLPEEFVSLRTATKCAPKCARCWRTLSHYGLGPNVVQNVLLVGGLCLTADFDHMWSKHLLLIRGLAHAADCDQMWSKNVPLEGGIFFATEFDHIWINNKLIIEKGLYQTNGLEASIDAELKLLSPITLPFDQPTSLNKKMMHLVSITQQMTNDADRTQPSPIQHCT
jgi:hypothetical protein